MRKTILAALLAALAVGLVPAATATTATTVAVSITRNAFVPKAVTINVGDSVKWTNKDTRRHQVSCSKCPFTSGVLNPGGSFTHTFKTAGKFAIVDPLHAKIKGSVTVKATNEVSLVAKPRVIKYLQSTILSGTVGTGKSGEHVSILSKKCGETAYSRLTTLTTGTDGIYTLKQTPGMNTAYEAKWKTSTSKTRAVGVRPRIKFAKIGSHKYRVRVKAAQSFVGKRVVFQKLTAAMTWTRVKRVTLTKLAVFGSTDVSSKSFKVRIRHGKTVRMLLKPSQAAPCYLGNHSRSLKS
jgi:plastocyanin